MKDIVQSETTECGLACLSMVTAHHGVSLGLPEMRRRFSLSLKGAKLNDLVHIAQQLGLQAWALRLDFEQLSELKTPCILHWDLNHFVVLTKVDKFKVTILDPA